MEEGQVAPYYQRYPPFFFVVVLFPPPSVHLLSPPLLELHFLFLSASFPSVLKPPDSHLRSPPPSNVRILFAVKLNTLNQNFVLAINPQLSLIPSIQDQLQSSFYGGLQLPELRIHRFDGD
jgi:hypothetical protein